MALGKNGQYWSTSYLYPDDSNPDGLVEKGWWFSFDGVGRVWYDRLALAMSDTGLDPHPSFFTESN